MRFGYHRRKICRRLCLREWKQYLGAEYRDTSQANAERPNNTLPANTDVNAMDPWINLSTEDPDESRRPCTEHRGGRRATAPSSGAKLAGHNGNDPSTHAHPPSLFQVHPVRIGCRHSCGISRRPHKRRALGSRR